MMNLKNTMLSKRTQTKIKKHLVEVKEQQN